MENFPGDESPHITCELGACVHVQKGVIMRSYKDWYMCSVLFNIHTDDTGENIKWSQIKLQVAERPGGMMKRSYCCYKAAWLVWETGQKKTICVVVGRDVKSFPLE